MSLVLEKIVRKKGQLSFLYVSLYPCICAVCLMPQVVTTHHFIVKDEESCFAFCGDGMYQHIHSVTLLQLF